MGLFLSPWWCLGLEAAASMFSHVMLFLSRKRNISLFRPISWICHHGKKWIVMALFPKLEGQPYGYCWVERFEWQQDGKLAVSTTRAFLLCGEMTKAWGFQVKVLLKLENRVTKASFAKLSSFKPSYWSSQSAQHLHIQEASEWGPDWWLCPSLADPWFMEQYIHPQSSFIEMIDAFSIF